MDEKSIPPAIQHQFLIRLSLALAALIGGTVLWCIEGVMAAVPLLILALLLTTAALRIRRFAAEGRFLALRGTVLRAETTLILRRQKALILAVDGKAIRLELHNRRKPVQPGRDITIYVLDDTPLYEWHGLHMLANYLVLTLEG